MLLATNCFRLRGAEETYRKLLPELDILCPFGFHRMPPDDWTGEDAARLLQSLCDEAGCHLWMEVETCLFRNGVELHPRPIESVANDLMRFPNFEKIMHYQFPGLMSGPGMSRQPGGPAARELYDAYARFLREGVPPRLAHAALGKPVQLAASPDAGHPGRGPGGLVDGRRASEDYRDPQWMGFLGNDFEAVVDLGGAVDVTAIGLRRLQLTWAGIYQPKEVRFAVSDDGKQFTEVAKVGPSLGPADPGPEIAVLRAESLKARGRWVRVRAVSVGAIPPGRWHTGAKAWLFVDELLVNPKHGKGL